MNRKGQTEGWQHSWEKEEMVEVIVQGVVSLNEVVGKTKPNSKLWQLATT